MQFVKKENICLSSIKLAEANVLKIMAIFKGQCFKSKIIIWKR